jgi:hypothetical protein
LSEFENKQNIHYIISVGWVLYLYLYTWEANLEVLHSNADPGGDSETPVLVFFSGGNPIKEVSS